MNPVDPSLDSIDPERIARAALQAFFAIAQRWHLSEPEQRQLLGNPPANTFQHWIDNKTDAALDEDVLLRISALMNIEKRLYQLLPAEQADGWVRRPNTAPLFQGQPALDTMQSGDLQSLLDVLYYLETRCA